MHRASIIGYAVHFLTASGVVCAAFITAAILAGDHRRAFIWMVLATVIDSFDGMLARRYRVRETAPKLDGARLDDIVDYLNYTFLPLILIGSAGWLPYPAWVWVALALLASLLAFSNVGAKEDAGFFLGFPSYWNVFAIYVALWLRFWGGGWVLAITLLLAVASVLPIRFLYVSRSPRWRLPMIFGGIVWTVQMLVLLLRFSPNQPASHAEVLLSLTYPVFYVVASIYLSRRIPSPSVSDAGQR